MYMTAENRIMVRIQDYMDLDEMETYIRMDAAHAISHAEDWFTGSTEM